MRCHICDKIMHSTNELSYLSKGHPHLPDECLECEEASLEGLTEEDEWLATTLDDPLPDPLRIASTGQQSPIDEDTLLTYDEQGC